MKRIFWITLLGLGYQSTVFAQQPKVTIVPLIAGIPMTCTNIRDVNSLQIMDQPMLEQTLATLRSAGINLDSCVFITKKEHFNYAAQLGTWDFDYTYCNINFEDGKMSYSASIYYNGFARQLLKPKVNILYSRSEDGLHQNVSILQYRGLAPQVSEKEFN